MSIDYKGFMGLETPTVSATDKLLAAVFQEVLEMLECEPSAYNDIQHLVDRQRIERPEYDYFWDWMEGKGFALLASLDRPLPNSEELADFLDYRRVVLELDRSNGDMDMMIVSISELLVAANAFFSAFFETSASIELSGSSIPIDNRSNTTTNNRWIVVKSSAEPYAELLLYA